MKFCLLFFTLIALSSARLEKLDDIDLDKTVNQKINDKNGYNFFNRKLDTIKNKTHFEFVSKESENMNKKNIGFKFMVNGDGVELNFNANKNVSEYTRIVFKKILYNGTELYDFKDNLFNDMTCFNSSSYKSCFLSMKDSFMTIRADFNTELYFKSFNNKTKRYFPTDIKVTVIFNTTMHSFGNNDSFVLVSRMKTDNKNYFNNSYKQENEDNFYGNLTYMSFETYAVDDNQNEFSVKMIKDNILRRDVEDNEDDEREFNFLFNLDNMTNILTWDPTFGATTSFADTSDLSASSATSFTVNIFLLSVIFIITNIF